jgi:hypothetical protein
MSYDKKTGKFDLKGELSWIAVSLISGIIMTSMFVYYNRFPGVSLAFIIICCCVGVHLLSILIRAQNHRGKVLSGKTAFKEKYLKYSLPFLAIGIGLLFIFF